MHVIDRENATEWVATLRRVVGLHSGALLQPHERMTGEELRDTRNTIARVQAALDRGDERITVQDDGSVPYERATTDDKETDR